ncbi:MAG: urate hydroxylase PuuD [Geminicoccaceae bacterium]
MNAIIWEWVDLAVRWLHVIAGVAWIGSSFYFVHLDASLKKREGLPEGAGGETWQVHGGGFYNMVKYLVAPARMPDELTWFKWEAYTTWLSGMVLLVIVYYFGAELYLVDPKVLDLPVWAAIAISVGGLAIGWLFYDFLCKSPFGADDTRLAAGGLAFLTILALGFTLIFSGRGAYMQMGALIGTIMVANVFLIIIPNQKKVVADLLAGRQPAAELGAQAKQRSMHNNYLTLPVLFLMISGHYPLTFASQYNWLILGIVLVMGAVIRHFFNSRHQGKPSPWWTWAAAAAGMAAIMWLSGFEPAIDRQRAEADFEGPISPQSVAFSDVENIILSRCSMCHAREPLWQGMVVPPKGVVLETPRDIRLHAREIELQSVRSHAMPPANITWMEPYERLVLAAWLEAGVKTE